MWIIFIVMKANLTRIIIEKFGDPIDDKLGTKVGDVKDITSVGLVGVRDELEDTCSSCGEMPVEGSCGCDHSSDEDGAVCPGCGMMVVNGQCGCKHNKVCPMCGQMPPTIDSSCPCEISEGDDACSQCGMNETHCECDM